MFTRKAFFLDKDGVIVPHSEDPEIIPKSDIMEQAIQGLRMIAKTNYLCIVISNQGWVNKGRLGIDEVVELFEDLSNNVRKAGGRIDYYLFCPHVDADRCICRKPKPGMINLAVNNYSIQKEESPFIGDKTTDVKCGQNAGVPTILVRTGYAGKDDKCLVTPDYVAQDLTDAVDYWLSRR